jgi:hypothetical protein
VCAKYTKNKGQTSQNTFFRANHGAYIKFRTALQTSGSTETMIYCTSSAPNFQYIIISRFDQRQIILILTINNTFLLKGQSVLF